MRTAYEQLEEQAEWNGWPMSYKEDLTKHDRNMLEGDDPPTMFAWVLRPMGTHLLDLRMNPESLRGFISHFRTNPSALFYIYNDSRFMGNDLDQFHFEVWAARILALCESYKGSRVSA